MAFPPSFKEAWFRAKIKSKNIFTELNIEVNNSPVTLKVNVDTGSQGNILPLRTFRNMYPEKIDLHGKPTKGTTKSSVTKVTAYHCTPHY